MECMIIKSQRTSLLYINKTDIICWWISRATNFKNACCDNYHDNSRGTELVHFLRAWSIMHVFGKGRQAKQESLVSFISGATFFLIAVHRKPRAIAIVTAAGVRLSPRNLANPFVASRKRTSLTNGCHRRTPSRPLPVSANVLTLSVGSVRILTDKIYMKKRRQEKNPTSLLNELTRADMRGNLTE